MMSVDNAGTFDGAERSAPHNDGFAAAAGFGGAIVAGSPCASAVGIDGGTIVAFCGASESVMKR